MRFLKAVKKNKRLQLSLFGISAIKRQGELVFFNKQASSHRVFNLVSLFAKSLLSEIKFFGRNCVAVHSKIFFLFSLKSNEFALSSRCF